MPRLKVFAKKPSVSKRAVPPSGHCFEIAHTHKLPDAIREEEARVQTTCFRCHGSKPFGGSWLCEECDKAVKAVVDRQSAKFAGKKYPKLIKGPKP